MRSTSRLLALTIAFAIGFADAALAQDAPADGQAASQQAEPPPTPDRGTTAQLKCIEQNSDYKAHGKHVFFEQAFENKCEVRMRCTVYAYLINARGPTQGHATLLLGPKSAGAAAKKIYAIKVKGSGGSAMSSRECRAL